VEYEDALGVNDSNRIVGFTYSCPSPGTLRASFRDTPTGIPTSINLLPGDTVSRATAVNNPGFIVGYSGVDPDFASAHAFLRTLDGNVAALGSIPGGPVSSFAFAISANSEIVGGTAIAPTGVAWRWTPEGGMVDINTLLASPSPEWVVAEARGVNESGQMAVTLRRVSDGFLRLARLDPIASCAADFDCDGVVNSADFFSFLTAFFSDAPAADFNHDFVINSADFFEFLAAFFAGC
jgi:hypothetical protein